MNNKDLSKKIVETLSDKKAQDIVEIYVGNLTTLTDYFIICTGTSDRHMKTLAENLDEVMSEDGILPSHIEGKGNGGWVLMDYGDIVVNIFDEDSRTLYNLERLWADGDIVRIEELITDRE